jgi:hypothetical protein
MSRFRDWKMFENGGQASPPARRVARVVARSYEFIAREVRPHESAVGN